MRKRWLSLFMALAVCLTSIPVSAADLAEPADGEQTAVFAEESDEAAFPEEVAEDASEEQTPAEAETEEPAEETADEESAAEIVEELSEETAEAEETAAAEESSEDESDVSIASLFVEDVVVWEGSTHEDYEWSMDESGKEICLSYNRYTYEPSGFVQMADGTEFEGTLWQIAGQIGETYGVYCEAWTVDSQGYGQEWVTGETYACTAWLTVGDNDIKAPFNAEVRECLILSLTAYDVAIDNHNKTELEGELLDENGNVTSVMYEGYYYSPEVELETVDGEFYTGTAYDVCEQLNESYGCQYYPHFIDDQSPDNFWGEDEEHTAEIRIGTVSAMFNVRITPGIIASVSAEDVTVYEGNSQTEYEYVTDEETGEETCVSFEKYYCWPELTVTMSDGNEYSGSTEEIGSWLYETYDYSCEYSMQDDQSYNNTWQPGNTYRAAIVYDGITAEFNVTIEPSPLVSMTAEDVILNEFQVQEEEDWDDETEEWIIWPKYNYEPQVTLETSDGEYLYGTADEVREQLQDLYGSYFRFECSDDQSRETPWSVGNHEAEIRIGSVSASFTVTVEESLIQSLTVEDVTVYEGEAEFDYSYYYDEYDEEHEIKWERYSYSPVITIVTTDGSEYHGQIGEVRDALYEEYGLEFDCHCTDDQEYDNQWSVGETYNGILYAGNLSAEYTVTVVPSLVKQVTVNHVYKQAENKYQWAYDSDGYEYRRYYFEPDSITVTMQDGEEFSDMPTIVAEEIFDAYGMNPHYSVRDDQSPENEWTAGNTYSADFVFGGKTAQFQAEIVPEPIKSMTIEDKEINELELEYISSDGYELLPETVTVVTKDNETFSGEFFKVIQEVGEKYDLYPSWGVATERDEYEYWEVGSYTAVMVLFGTEYEYTVIVGESPFISLEVEDVAVFAEVYDMDNDWVMYNVEPRYITLTTTDRVISGDPQSVVNQVYQIYGIETSYYCEDGQSEETPMEAGNSYQVVYHFGDLSAEYTVTVKEGFRILSVSIENLEVYEGNTERYVIGDDEVDLLPCRPKMLTIETTTGNFIGDYYTVQNQFYQMFREDLHIRIETSQSADEVWTASDEAYPAELVFENTNLFEDSADARVPFDVYVLECPIKKIEADPVTVYLNNIGTLWDGEGNEYPGFMVRPDKVVVTMKDGATFEGSVEAVLEKLSDKYESVHWLEITSDQSEDNIWEAGRHQAEISFMGASGKFTVYVKPDAFDSGSYELDRSKMQDNEYQTTYGKTGKFTVMDVNMNKEPEDLMWFAANKKILTLDNKGNFQTLKVGSTNVYVHSRDGKYHDDFQVMVEFDDVADESRYFYDPVYWAVENSITTGTKPNLFSPDTNCTREQVVTFLWRLQGCPEPSANAPKFKDVPATAYYYKAVSWAAEKKITVGLNDGTGRFGTGQPCTREQVVTFLYRTAGQPAVSGSNSFKDTKKSAYYYKAVTWAVQQGITKGVSKTKFGVGQSCVRAMIVTFLQRYANP